MPHLVKFVKGFSPWDKFSSQAVAAYKRSDENKKRLNSSFRSQSSNSWEEYMNELRHAIAKFVDIELRKDYDGAYVVSVTKECCIVEFPSEADYTTFLIKWS